MGVVAEDNARKSDHRTDWSDDSKQMVFWAPGSRAWRAPLMHRALVDFLF